MASPPSTKRIHAQDTSACDCRRIIGAGDWSLGSSPRPGRHDRSGQWHRHRPEWEPRRGGPDPDKESPDRLQLRRASPAPTDSTRSRASSLMQATRSSPAASASSRSPARTARSAWASPTREDFTLQQQSTVLSTVVTVAEATPVINPSKTGTGTTVGDSALRRLPTLNRNFADFVTSFRRSRPRRASCLVAASTSARTRSRSTAPPPAISSALAPPGSREARRMPSRSRSTP